MYPALLARSEGEGKWRDGSSRPTGLTQSGKKARVLYWKPLVSLAACLAVVLGAVAVFRGGSQVTPPGPTPPSVQSDQPSRLPALILNGGDVGELTLCRDYREEQAGPGFVIFVNQSVYAITQEEESWVIRPRDALGAEYPPIDMTITHLAGTDPEEALQARREVLAGEFEEVTEIQANETGLWCLASGGTAWDSPQVGVQAVGDLEGGSYLFVSRYFLEAAEGHGVRFRDMVETFQVVLGAGRQEVPAWLEQLQGTTGQLMDAYFANRLYQVPELLTGEAATYTGNGYGEDVSGWVSVAGVSWEVDNETAPSKATVTVRHGGESEGGYAYLTMGLVNTPEGWKLSWTGLEK